MGSVLLNFDSRDSSVGIATGYGLDDRGVGVRVPVGLRIFSPRRPDRLWGPPSLLSKGYRGLIPRFVNQNQVSHAEGKTLVVLQGMERVVDSH
jgi:hypothetical protein